MAPTANGKFIYPAGAVHKIFASVTTFQDPYFYPMQLNSPGNLVAFDGAIKRGAVAANNSPEKSVQLLDVCIGKDRPQLQLLSFLDVSTEHGSNLGEELGAL